MNDKSNADIKGDLKNLWKATVDQFDEIKDVIVKGSHAGQARLDAAVLERQREAALKALGEMVYQYGPKEDMPTAWHEKFKEIKELEGKIASQRDEFDHLVRDVKEAIPDIDFKPADDATPAEERKATSDAPPSQSD